MNNQSGPDGCTEQTSGLDLLVGPPRAHSVRMGASCARARGALHAHVYSIQIRVQDPSQMVKQIIETTLKTPKYHVFFS